MSFDTVTIFADTINKKVLPIMWSFNGPSRVLNLSSEFSEWWAQDVSCEPSNWKPVWDEYLTYDGKIDIDAQSIDALAIATLDVNNPFGVYVCGATYKVTDRRHFLCTARKGDILEKVFPQGCTLTFNFERRLTDYIKQKRIIRFNNILEILKR